MTVWLGVRTVAPARVPSWAAAALHAWAGRAGGTALRGIASIARHTGVPAAVVGAIALVIAFRVARRAVHLIVEVALAVALVFAATKAGWIRF
jgi:hypothetical protein